MANSSPFFIIAFIWYHSPIKDGLSCSNVTFIFEHLATIDATDKGVMLSNSTEALLVVLKCSSSLWMLLVSLPPQLNFRSIMVSTELPNSKLIDAIYKKYYVFNYYLISNLPI